MASVSTVEQEPFESAATDPNLSRGAHKAAHGPATEALSTALVGVAVEDLHMRERSRLELLGVSRSTPRPGVRRFGVER